MFQNPRCDVFPYKNDTSKVKFECEMDTPEIGAELEIIGAGENINESPHFVYSIVDYDHFINTSRVICHMGIKGIAKSCAFPHGIRIKNVTEGGDAIFKINANFEIDDLMIDWQLVKIDKTVVETTKYSLWFHEKHTYMLFYNVSSITGTEGIIVRCECIKIDEYHNTSEVIGIGFVDLDGHEIELALDSHDDNNNTNTSGGYLCNIGNQETHRNQRNVVLTYVFLGLWLTSSIIGLIAGLIGHVRKQTYHSTGLNSVIRVTLVNITYRGYSVLIPLCNDFLEIKVSSSSQVVLGLRIPTKITLL